MQFVRWYFISNKPWGTKRHELVPSFARDTIESLDKIQYFDIPRVFNNLTSKFVKIFQKYLHCYILVIS